MDQLAGFTEEARKLALDRFRLIQPHLEQNLSLRISAPASLRAARNSSCDRNRSDFYGTLHLQTGGWAVYAQKMIYKEMFFRSHGKIPNWGLPLAKWSAETLKI
jgi:hypothetical protein